MTPNVRHRWSTWTALAICGIAVMISGCSVSINTGTKTVDQSAEVALAKRFISHQLSDLPPAESIDCPDDVDAKAGTTYACQATLNGGQEVSLPFRVTSVNGDNARLDPNSDLVNQGLAVEVVYKASDFPLKSSNPSNSGVKSVDCPTDVPAKEGKRFDCKETLITGNTITATIEVETATQNNQNLKVVGFHKD